jgi:membrane-associated protein
MPAMPDWLSQLYSNEGLAHLISTGGLILLCAIVFAETGLLVGFFLPGDSLLVTAGVLSALDPAKPGAAPLFDYWPMAGLLILAAILGDLTNRTIGLYTGAKVWNRPDGRFFKRRHLEEAHAFYQNYGGFALAAGRFIPVARTFVPFAAGMVRMPLRRYLAWNVAGAVLWVMSMTALGHWFGGQQYLREHLHLLVLAVIAVSFIPVVVGVVRRLRQGERST